MAISREEQLRNNRRFSRQIVGAVAIVLIIIGLFTVLSWVVGVLRSALDDTERRQSYADRLGHDRRYGIDPTKIKNDLGWYPETPFEKGIVLTIDWYLNHEEWMEHITSGNYQKYYEEMYKNK